MIAWLSCSTMVQYKFWRSRQDKELHLLTLEGGFDALPTPIRHLGPWQASKEGQITDLKLAYRVILAEQAFVLVYAHVSKLQLEGRPAIVVQNFRLSAMRWVGPRTHARRSSASGARHRIRMLISAGNRTFVVTLSPRRLAARLPRHGLGLR